MVLDSVDFTVINRISFFVTKVGMNILEAPS